MEIKLILTACVVSFGVPSVQPLNQKENRAVARQGNDGGEIQENFQNLFDSIVENDTERSDAYREILKQKVTRERHAFNAMKEEIRVARDQNSSKRKFFYHDSERNKNVAVVKRATSESYMWPSNNTKTKSRKKVKFTTKNKGPKMKWFTMPTPAPTPSTDSWDPALGFNKIEIVEPIIDPTRGDLEDEYYCRQDDKVVRKGSHYFDYDNCVVWHCPKWPIPVGVYDFVFYNCTDIDVRMFPLYHKECRVHRCPTKRIDLDSPYILPTVPEEYRTVIPFSNRTIFPESPEVVTSQEDYD